MYSSASDPNESGPNVPGRTAFIPAMINSISTNLSSYSFIPEEPVRAAQYLYFVQPSFLPCLLVMLFDIATVAKKGTTHDNQNMPSSEENVNKYTNIPDDGIIETTDTNADMNSFMDAFDSL